MGYEPKKWWTVIVDILPCVSFSTEILQSTRQYSAALILMIFFASFVNCYWQNRTAAGSRPRESPPGPCWWVRRAMLWGRSTREYHYPKLGVMAAVLPRTVADLLDRSPIQLSGWVLACRLPARPVRNVILFLIFLSNFWHIGTVKCHL